MISVRRDFPIKIFFSNFFFQLYVVRLGEVNIRMQSVFVLTTDCLPKVQFRNLLSRTFSARSFVRSEGWTYIQMGPILAETPHFTGALKRDCVLSVVVASPANH